MPLISVKRGSENRQTSVTSSAASAGPASSEAMPSTDVAIATNRRTSAPKSSDDHHD